MAKHWLLADVGFVEASRSNANDSELVTLAIEDQKMVVAVAPEELVDLIEKLEAAGGDLWGRNWRQKGRS